MHCFLHAAVSTWLACQVDAKSGVTVPWYKNNAPSMLQQIETAWLHAVALAGWPQACSCIVCVCTRKQDIDREGGEERERERETDREKERV